MMQERNFCGVVAAAAKAVEWLVERVGLRCPRLGSRSYGSAVSREVIGLYGQLGWPR